MNTPSPATLASIYRYPVKGLTPEPLPQVALRPGQTLPADRAFAIENGPSGFDPAHPVWKAKTHYLMLMRNERLAALRTQFDDTTQTLSISADGAELVRGDLGSVEGRAAIEAFFAARFADELRGPPKLLAGAGYSFSDVAMKVVSIINLASVAALAQVIGKPVDPLRFRGNLYVGGWPAWHEFDLLGRTLSIGDARLKVVKRIVRCAATNVDPETAARDLAIPATLQRTYGHADLGVYAQVIEGGTIAAGDAIESTQPALL
ncbi:MULTISPECIES: MOSC domain-containing protein [Rhodopseudomonas]|uniref:Molybdenum cofactor sulfurase n=1 Tax=Rhodopseudomonas palustris TaxID=1076 RepID=A0A0D7F351_RHOPL|nr:MULTISPECIES: MOSC domain-containing protein [Rhodopseudomonas]KIZ47484.1 molybdenum cofactor sulfurase [Rhodopseudomonas palustris]MDF3811062.1 MOSC domain-containing protein [Rhodopseudomonas sp. BAL398]WOK15621.1 MOSC domain-containing protein [Rhodopseudomonas sp. BAL398]